MKRVKPILKAILLRLPGGKWFYHKVYLPRVLPTSSTASQAASATAQPMQQSIPLPGKDNVYRAILEQDLVLQEEWTMLLKDIVSHFKFLDKFMQGDIPDQEARQRLEEYYRHHKTLILMFEALLARQESQTSWLRTILSGPYDVDADRAQRLEQVIDYLVEIVGEPYARRPDWEH
ncbi:MAG: hypothetical protein QXS68_05765 [Candidatus Methanomethylicaceae archaeon]